MKGGKWLGMISLGLLLLVAYRQNMAFVALNHYVAEQGFVGGFNSQNVANGGARWQAFAYGLQGQTDLAAGMWAPAGYTFADLLQKGQQAVQQGHYEDSLWWYQMAEALQPDDEQLWVLVGQSCRVLLTVGGLCDRFGQQNGGNWLVDPSFHFGLTYWRNLAVGDDNYEVVACPGRSGNCAFVVSQQRASLYQCFRVVPGRDYRFTVWLKVVVTENAFWRPAYYQGKINDQDFGYWPGDQHQSSDWQQWDHRFTAPAFDYGLACFHPVRLQGPGQAWFTEPQLLRQN